MHCTTDLPVTGLSLLTLASQESSAILRDPDDGVPSFARQLYIHASTYILRGLPRDLNTEEKLSIRSALPEDVLSVPSLDSTSRELVQSNGSHVQPSSSASTEPSLLHRLLASGIIHLFFLMHILLPYAKLLISYIYRYERQHHISERAFSSAVNTVDEMGRRSLRFTSAVCSLNNGKVGQTIGDVAVWWIQSVTGGIHEGVGEGMVILGARRESGGGERGENGDEIS